LNVFYVKTSKTLTIETCVKDLSDLLNEIGERYSPPLPRATGENTRKGGFLHTKAYKSKTKIYFNNFFLNPKRQAFMYLMCIFILSVVFW
jgi:hypothetical protein